MSAQPVLNINSSTTQQDRISAYVESLGIVGPEKIIYNPSYDDLFRAETDPRLYGPEKGVITESGAVNVNTGKYTGRSPKDKYIVLDDTTVNTVWWNSQQAKNDNKPISPEIWNDLKTVVNQQLSGKTLYVVDHSF